MERTPSQTTGDLEQLFLRFREHGDQRALADVYDRTAVELLSVATHLCRDPIDAEDAVQATFLAALESAEAWQSDKKLMPWLLGILTNRVKRLRRLRNRRVEEERLTSSPSVPPSATLESVEFTRAVDEAIGKMPRMYQSVLVLRLKHGMNPVDISHALRRPLGTVRSQLCRGLEHSARRCRRSLPEVWPS